MIEYEVVVTEASMGRTHIYVTAEKWFIQDGWLSFTDDQGVTVFGAPQASIVYFGKRKPPAIAIQGVA